MQHNYTERLETKVWKIEISPSTQYGYFENKYYGNGGGLWFDEEKLIDYDGVAELPEVVIDMLVDAEYDVSEIIVEDDNV